MNIKTKFDIGEEVSSFEKYGRIVKGGIITSIIIHAAEKLWISYRIEDSEYSTNVEENELYEVCGPQNKRENP